MMIWGEPSYDDLGRTVMSGKNTTSSKSTQRRQHCHFPNLRYWLRFATNELATHAQVRLLLSPPRYVPAKQKR
jgi:hypothetical protein